MSLAVAGHDKISQLKNIEKVKVFKRTRKESESFKDKINSHENEWWLLSLAVPGHDAGLFTAATKMICAGWGK